MGIRHRKSPRIRSFCPKRLIHIRRAVAVAVAVVAVEVEVVEAVAVEAAQPVVRPECSTAYRPHPAPQLENRGSR